MSDKLLYLDCFSGIAGDMMLGALIDLGVDGHELVTALRSLPLKNWNLEHRVERRMGLRGVDVKITIGGQVEGPAIPDDGSGLVATSNAHNHGPHRHYGEIIEIINRGQLPDIVRQRAIDAFNVLADAEAHVHGIERESVHFHEVGATDSILDIVGCAWGIWALGIDRIESSPLPMGRGFSRCTHGRIPQPAPATLHILAGVPVVPAGIDRELVTPTGAAFIKGWAARVGPYPEMTIDRIGWGAGDSEFQDRPNLLRAVLGNCLSVDDECITIEANLDDLNPEVAGFLLTRLLDAGALDAWFVPIQMKKNRPGIIISALTRASRRTIIENVLLSESSAIGLRYHRTHRTVLERTVTIVSTPWGEVGVKTAWRDGHLMNAAPEYDDCVQIAERSGIPLKVVYQHAIAQYVSHHSNEVDE